MATGATSARRVGMAKSPPKTGAVRIAMLAALLIAARIGWIVQFTVGNDARKRGLALSRLDTYLPDIFILLPFAVAFVLLSWKKNRTAVAAGAGVALVIFAGEVFACFGQALQLFLWAGLSPEPLLFQAFLLVLPLFVACVCAVVFSIRARQDPRVFGVAACLTVVYGGIGMPRIKLHEFRAGQKQQRAVEARNSAGIKTSFDAHHVVAMLTGCLIEWHAGNPESEYPATLDDLPGDLKLPQGAACDPTLAKPPKAENYTFTYMPIMDENNRRVNFQLRAVPGGQQKWTRRRSRIA